MTRGVRGTFETRRATLAVKSQGRLLPSSLEIAIAVSSRATLAVKSEGRVAKDGVFLRFACLKCRTVVSYGLQLLSIAELSLPNASPWLPWAFPGRALGRDLEFPIWADCLKP